MFDTTNFEKINDEAFIWRGFLDPQLSDDAFQESWELSQEKDKYVREVDSIELLGGRMDQRIIDKVNKFFENTEFEPLDMYSLENSDTIDIIPNYEDEVDYMPNYEECF